MVLNVTTLDVPDMRDADGTPSAFSCLLAVCAYFGIEPHLGRAFEDLLHRSDSDTTPDDIICASRDLGLDATLLAALPLGVVEKVIGAGTPIITDLVRGRCIVVYGMTDSDLLVLDPQQGQIELPLDDWPAAWGIVLDAPGVERQWQTIDIPGDAHYDLADHYANTWNYLHDRGEMVPHLEMSGAHENLAGTDWHVDLGHDGVWRPMHHEDMMRVYGWPAVEKCYGMVIEKARKKPPNPQQDLFGQWIDADKPSSDRHLQSSDGFEAVHPRRGRGAGGGRFSQINTGPTLGQRDLFDAGAESALPAAPDAPPSPQESSHDSPKGGVTMAGQSFEQLHPRRPKGEHGGQFSPKGAGTQKPNQSPAPKAVPRKGGSPLRYSADNILAKNPAGTYSFVGNVAGALAYKTADGGIPSEEDLAMMRQSGSPALEMESRGVKRRIFKTPEEAADFAEEHKILIQIESLIAESHPWLLQHPAVREVHGQQPKRQDAPPSSEESSHDSPKGGVTAVPAAPEEKENLLNKQKESANDAVKKEFSDQDKSYREQARTFDEVMANPEDASKRDLTVARGHIENEKWQAQKRWERGEISKEQMDWHVDSLNREALHLDRLLRDRIAGRSIGPEDLSRAEKIAERAYQENRSAVTIAREMGLSLDEYRGIRKDVERSIEEKRKLAKQSTSPAL